MRFDDLYTWLTIVVMIFTIACAGFYFRSVWIRRGYQGIDGILDLIEVKAYYLHVCGFIILLTLEVMTFGPSLSERAKPIDGEAWYVIGLLAGAIFTGEIVADVKKSFSKMPNNPTNEK